MASESIALRVHKSPLQVVYEWLATADHKKIGLMYIVYALLFLVVMGIEAILMRIQLSHANATFLSPEVFNRLFTLARHHRRVLRGHADPFRFWKLSGAR